MASKQRTALRKRLELWLPVYAAVTASASIIWQVYAFTAAGPRISMIPPAVAFVESGISYPNMMSVRYPLTIANGGTRATSILEIVVNAECPQTFSAFAMTAGRDPTPIRLDSGDAHTLQTNFLCEAGFVNDRIARHVPVLANVHTTIRTPSGYFRHSGVTTIVKTSLVPDVAK